MFCEIGKSCFAENVKTGTNILNKWRKKSVNKERPKLERCRLIKDGHDN